MKLVFDFENFERGLLDEDRVFCIWKKKRRHQFYVVSIGDEACIYPYGGTAVADRGEGNCMFADTDIEAMHALFLELGSESPWVEVEV